MTDRGVSRTLPGEITVRELRYRRRGPGFPDAQVVTLVTTLLDAEAYPRPSWPSSTAGGGRSS